MGKTINKETTNKQGLIKIYRRGIDFIRHDGIPRGPKLHPFLKDWKGNYHELINKDGIIVIGSGDLKNMSETTQFYMGKNQNIEPDDKIIVNKEKFQEAIKKFKKEHEGKKYSIFNFKGSCIAFKNYVIEKSEVK